MILSGTPSSWSRNRGNLTHYQPDIVKIDMELIRGIDQHHVKRSIVLQLLRLLEELGVTPLCEGIETIEERNVLRDFGIRLIQGYLLARPAFEALATPAALALPLYMAA